MSTLAPTLSDHRPLTKETAPNFDRSALMLLWKYCDCSIRVLDCSTCIRVYRSFSARLPALTNLAVIKLIVWPTALVWYQTVQIHIDGSSEARFNYATQAFCSVLFGSERSIRLDNFFVDEILLTQQLNDPNDRIIRPTSNAGKYLLAF